MCSALRPKLKLFFKIVSLIAHSIWLFPKKTILQFSGSRIVSFLFEHRIPQNATKHIIATIKKMVDLNINFFIAFKIGNI